MLASKKRRLLTTHKLTWMVVGDILYLILKGLIHVEDLEACCLFRIKIGLKKKGRW